jgi:flagellin-specific chaperone FliS
MCYKLKLAAFIRVIDRAFDILQELTLSLRMEGSEYRYRVIGESGGCCKV